MTITTHAIQRIQERDDSVNGSYVAKRQAKIAYQSGMVIGKFSNSGPFFDYLSNRKRRNGANSSIRIYNGNIYIWRGNAKKLVTVLPVPDKYQEAYAAVVNGKEVM